MYIIDDIHNSLQKIYVHNSLQNVYVYYQRHNNTEYMYYQLP